MRIAGDLQSEVSAPIIADSESLQLTGNWNVTLKVPVTV
jgi:hypothetical protein